MQMLSLCRSHAALNASPTRHTGQQRSHKQARSARGASRPCQRRMQRRNGLGGAAGAALAPLRCRMLAIAIAAQLRGDRSARTEPPPPRLDAQRFISALGGAPPPPGGFMMPALGMHWMQQNAQIGPGTLPAKGNACVVRAVRGEGVPAGASRRAVNGCVSGVLVDRVGGWSERREACTGGDHVATTLLAPAACVARAGLEQAGPARAPPPG